MSCIEEYVFYVVNVFYVVINLDSIASYDIVV